MNLGVGGNPLFATLEVICRRLLGDGPLIHALTPETVRRPFERKKRGWKSAAIITTVVVRNIFYVYITKKEMKKM
jgi:hypothetical protein